MKNKIVHLPVLSLCLLVGGCAGLINEEISWRKFYDSQNGPIKEVTFGKKVYQMNHKAQMYEEVGYARIKNGKLFNVFRHDDNKQFALTNLDTDQVLKTASVADFQELGKAKSINLYEFGNAILESASFYSKNGVCRDFSSKIGVTTKFATNYYKKYDIFVTIFGQATLTLGNGMPKNIKVVTKSYPQSKATTELENQIKKQAQQLAAQDATKLGSFLVLLCNRK